MLRPLGLGEESLESFAAEVAARSTPCDGGHQRGGRGRPRRCPRELLVAVLDSPHRASCERLGHSSAAWEAHEQFLHRMRSGSEATRPLPARMGGPSRWDARCCSPSILKSSGPGYWQTAPPASPERSMVSRKGARVGVRGHGPDGPIDRAPQRGRSTLVAGGPPAAPCLRPRTPHGTTHRRSGPRPTAFLQAAARRFSPRWAGRGRDRRRRSRPGRGRGLRSWPGPCRHAS